MLSVLINILCNVCGINIHKSHIFTPQKFAFADVTFEYRSSSHQKGDGALF